MSLYGRRPSMEDELQRKTTFDRRQPSMEDDLRWKTTFVGRRPSMEDDGRRPLWISCIIIMYHTSCIKNFNFSLPQKNTVDKNTPIYIYLNPISYTEIVKEAPEVSGDAWEEIFFSILLLNFRIPLNT